MLRDKLLKSNGIDEYFQNLREIFESADSIALFGAGVGGVNTLRWIDESIPGAKKRIKTILDNNPMKWDTELEGIVIRKPTMETLQGIDLLAITCGEGDVILDQLERLGLSSKTQTIIPDISAIDRSGKDFDYIWNNINAFEAVYSLLSDDKSKRVFENILNFKIRHDPELLDEIDDPYDQQYFDPDLIKYSSEDVFLDCGSYIGDTIGYYKKWSENVFKTVYAFEADERNYDLLREKTANDDRIVAYKCGVWDEIGTIRFNNLGSGSGLISDEGDIEINTDTIDHLVHEAKVSFIKMDIEGAEYNALIGGRHIIERDKPALMISVYHKQDDFIKIPMLIKSIVPEYRIYFRHYRKMSVQETVCYAIRR